MRKNNRTPKKKFDEKVIDIKRVATTTKGGRSISFTAMAAIGDKKGKIGLGYGKANGVPDAIKKAITDAEKNIVEITRKGTTIPHAVDGKFCSSKVILRPASEGTGVIAGSAVRDIIELSGVNDILTKIVGNKNKLNVAKATLQGLMELRSPEEIAKIRGKKVEEILS
ncbi:MAG: 30S ribosomal protein S5 [Fusobacteriota bacterium]